MSKFWKNWYWYVVAAFLMFVTVLYLICGENSYIAIHDNLDLFVAQYKMMKDTGTFFASPSAQVPFLGGINRGNLPSELALSSLLYVVFPMFVAYVVNYLLKVIIAVVSSYLLAVELYRGKGREDELVNYRALSVLCGLAYGMLNVFPAFGIPFASIPLLIYILLRIDRETDKKRTLWWYVALFSYPFVSYFSYFGLFICGYLVVAFIWVSIVRKKIAKRLLIAIPVISVGYVVFEYRLFSIMLFSDEVTIRGSMAGTDFSIAEVLKESKDVFLKGIFHAEAVQYKWVLPICLAFFVVLNIYYVCKKQPGKILRDPYNLIILVMVFNAFIYGIYDFEPVRKLVETLCPPLEGWQFNRTIFFNPFLWYAAFFVLLERLLRSISVWLEKSGDSEKKWISILSQGAAVMVVAVAMLVILLTDTRYNDLFHTSYYKALEVLKGKEIDVMNYREFYGQKLFEKAKEDIGYDGQWSVAYGFHPAVLEYNQIATLDGYLGFYSQEYKDAFREMIAPAIDQMEASRIYFDDWGARAYLYSATDVSIISEYKGFTITDYNLSIDVDAFHRLGGTYIFSRYELANIEDLGLVEVGAYEDDTIPYPLYVYK